MDQEDNWPVTLIVIVGGDAVYVDCAPDFAHPRAALPERRCTKVADGKALPARLRPRKSVFRPAGRVLIKALTTVPFSPRSVSGGQLTARIGDPCTSVLLCETR
jgi:hypothetical protein